MFIKIRLHNLLQVTKCGAMVMDLVFQTKYYWQKFARKQNKKIEVMFELFNHKKWGEEKEKEKAPHFCIE